MLCSIWDLFSWSSIFPIGSGVCVVVLSCCPKFGKICDTSGRATSPIPLFEDSTSGIAVSRDLDLLILGVECAVLSSSCCMGSGGSSLGMSLSCMDIASSSRFGDCGCGFSGAGGL